MGEVLYFVAHNERNFEARPYCSFHTTKLGSDLCRQAPNWTKKYMREHQYNYTNKYCIILIKCRYLQYYSVKVGLDFKPLNSYDYFHNLFMIFLKC